MSRPHERYPRLSEDLEGPISPGRCRSCGAIGTDKERLIVWREADDRDTLSEDPARQPLVVLCRECCAELIEPHQRLYDAMEHNRPWPGAMEVCIDCIWRALLQCTHPDARHNGGPGIVVRASRPFSAMYQGRDKKGRRTGGIMTVYPDAPSCQAVEHYDGRPPRSHEA